MPTYKLNFTDRTKMDVGSMVDEKIEKTNVNYTKSEDTTAIERDN